MGEEDTAVADMVEVVVAGTVEVGVAGTVEVVAADKVEVGAAGKDDGHNRSRNEEGEGQPKQTKKRT